MLGTRSLVAASSRELRALGWALVLSACSVGVGQGEASGLVSAPDCDLLGEAIDLRPDFFVADEFEGHLEIRMQRGGDYEYLSDGISIFVADVAQEHERLGTPVPLSAEAGAPVRMNLYLNERCPPDRHRPPVNYVAVSGNIVFTAIYAPEVDDNLLIAASFDSVRFVDPSRPAERFAIVSGALSFLYNRGRPAQRFP